VRISARALHQVHEFEPRDLTIRAGAGLPWRELQRVTGEHGLCVPLEPFYSSESSVGGVVAANISGPRRRLFGSARDLVIGMEYATLDGQLLESGGMVVKNVAGLDIQKLLIGSFGTLAAITSVNFKLSPMPEATRTWSFSFESASDVTALRDRILRSQLQPAALDVLNPAAAAFCGLSSYSLLIRAQGPEVVLQRYGRELPGGTALEGDAETALWGKIREFVPLQLAAHPDCIVVRAGWPMPDLEKLLASTAAPLLARAGSGAAYLCLGSEEELHAWVARVQGEAWSRLVEFAPEPVRNRAELWPSPGADLDLMRSMKEIFDPLHLLNRGRLYGRI
jgi:glycolate oxidase FAD binding subunit